MVYVAGLVCLIVINIGIREKWYLLNLHDVKTGYPNMTESKMKKTTGLIPVSFHLVVMRGFSLSFNPTYPSIIKINQIYNNLAY